LLLRGGRLVKHLHTEPGYPFGIGLAPQPGAYQVATERLQPGDHVLLYTDGVIEARSPQGEFFGVDRLIDLIARHEAAALSPAGVRVGGARRASSGDGPRTTKPPRTARSIRRLAVECSTASARATSPTDTSPSARAQASTTSTVEAVTGSPDPPPPSTTKAGG